MSDRKEERHQSRRHAGEHVRREGARVGRSSARHVPERVLLRGAAGIRRERRVGERGLCYGGRGAEEGGVGHGDQLGDEGSEGDPAGGRPEHAGAAGGGSV